MYSVALVSTAITLGLVSIAGAGPQPSPEIIWSDPANIVYCTLLSSTQLDSIDSDPVSRAPVPGIFVYTPPLGIVLSTGKHTLHAYFTPSDSTKYTTVSATVLINVNKATSTIT